MFQKLVHGFEFIFNTTHTSLSQSNNTINHSDMLNVEVQRTFGSSAANTTGSSDPSCRSFCPFEVTPIIPNESQLNDGDYQSQLNQSIQSNSSTSGLLGSTGMSAGANASHIGLTAELIRHMLEFMQQDVRNYS
jgi:hypothetical protein